MDDKIDLRIQRTYKLLTDSLITLISEKYFEDITVGEICERAMVRRATFYKHFGDKYELFTFLVKELQYQFEQNNPSRYELEKPQDYYVGMIDQTLSFLEQNKSMVTSILKSNASPILIDLLAKEIDFGVCCQLKEDQKQGVILPSNPELLSPMFTGALIYVAKWWILKNCEMSKDQIVQETVKILSNI